MPKESPWTAAEAATVSNDWTTKGAYSSKDEARPLDTWKVWKGTALAWVRSKKNKAITAARKAELSKWISQYEARQRWVAVRSGVAPEDPGVAPAGLVAAPCEKGPLGDPPNPAFKAIKRYDVRMPDGTAYSFTDHPFDDDYKWLRDNTGIEVVGKMLKHRSDLTQQIELAGITHDWRKHVLQAVSGNEGGFEAVNTYDTGFVSIGIIQFATGKTGNGSLASVLAQMKADNPGEYEAFFRSRGIGVAKGAVTAVDPATGSVLTGEAAVLKIISDKRLSAVFHDAGLKSQSFQTAQMKVSVRMYEHSGTSFPAIRVASWSDGKTTHYLYGADAKRQADEAAKAAGVKTSSKSETSITGTYGDVLTSEAGRAALMDRWVNRGSGKAAFLNGCLKVLHKHFTTTAGTLADLAAYEKVIIETVKLPRCDVLKRTDLTQPREPPQ